MQNMRYMLSAYFHQDWNHARDTWQGVVDDFLGDDPATVSAVPDEIDQLLSLNGDDDSLSESLIRLGCDNDPPEGDRAWLVAVRDRIVSRTQP